MNKTITTANQQLIRRLNTVSVMEVLRLYAPLSRAELSIRTRLNPGTVLSD